MDAALRADRRCRRLRPDGELGSLDPGNRADLVVVGDDPCAVGADALAAFDVVSSWLDGRTVHGGPLL